MKIFIVDAFTTNRPFSGNPAGVCLTEQECDSNWMQSVAAEMNLSETAFVRRLKDGFELRWCTPAVEVDLCGHATLASAHILWQQGIVDVSEPIRFHSRSGVLTCNRRKELIELDFPAIPVEPTDASPTLLKGLGVTPTFVGRSRFDELVIVESEHILRSLTPDLTTLRQLDVRGVIVSCQSDDSQFDFVSRFFAPGAGVDEDPVTGSAHCVLAPYWGEQLGKTAMIGFQASARGGIVNIKVNADRVILGGRAVTFLEGAISDNSSRLH